MPEPKYAILRPLEAPPKIKGVNKYNKVSSYPANYRQEYRQVRLPFYGDGIRQGYLSGFDNSSSRIGKASEVNIWKNASKIFGKVAGPISLAAELYNTYSLYNKWFSMSVEEREKINKNPHVFFPGSI